MRFPVEIAEGSAVDGGFTGEFCGCNTIKRGVYTMVGTLMSATASNERWVGSRGISPIRACGTYRHRIQRRWRNEPADTDRRDNSVARVRTDRGESSIP
jgi:hypothetical protein